MTRGTVLATIVTGGQFRILLNIMGISSVTLDSVGNIIELCVIFQSSFSIQHPSNCVILVGATSTGVNTNDSSCNILQTRKFLTRKLA
jgi:hypothetical protein